LDTHLHNYGSKNTPATQALSPAFASTAQPRAGSSPRARCPTALLPNLVLPFPSSLVQGYKVQRDRKICALPNPSHFSKFGENWENLAEMHLTDERNMVFLENRNLAELTELSTKVS
jgi:hypothetical protein